MGRMGSWSLFSNDDHGSGLIKKRASREGVPENIIKESQKAALRINRKREQRQAAEQAIRNKKKFCANCGDQFGIDDFPHMSLRSWIATVKCKNCPRDGQATNVKFCMYCGTQFERLPDQSPGSWGSAKLCSKCRSQ